MPMDTPHLSSPSGKGLAALQDIYQQREKKAETLQKQGRKILGYMCHFAPLEIMSAAGFVPFRIFGRRGENLVAVDDFIEPYGCPYVRNSFEQELQGRLNFLEGIVMAHSCDMVQRLYGIWRYYRNPKYAYLFNVPHQVTSWAQDFFVRESQLFLESLEIYQGEKVSEEVLEYTISLYNEIRHKIRQLYSLRKHHPPLLTGVEMQQVLIAGTCLPPEEYLQLLRETTEEVSSRQIPGPNSARNVRIMIWGSIVDDTRLFELIENCGAHVVVDDTCTGTRIFNHDVKQNDNPFQQLMKKYFLDFQCPRTDRGPGYQRFDYVKELVTEYRIDGVIGYTLAYCDPHKLDFPDLRDFLTQHSCPMLLIDDDYSLGNSEAIQNRIQAFIEMLK